MCLLCTWTQRLWICFGNSPCTYTYIHISRAVNLSDVANTCFLPSHRVRIFLLWVASGPRAPTVQPPHSLAAASLASGCCSAWGKNHCVHESMFSGVPLLYPFILMSHSVLLGDDQWNPKSSSGQACSLAWRMWWARYTQSRRHLAEAWPHGCSVTHYKQGMMKPALAAQREPYCTYVCEMQN